MNSIVNQKTSRSDQLHWSKSPLEKWALIGIFKRAERRSPWVACYDHYG